jgi:hypothetical protein
VKEDQQTELVCLFVRRDDVYFDYCLRPLVKEDEKEDTMGRFDCYLGEVITAGAVAQTSLKR